MKKIFTKSIITTLVCSMLVVTAAGCSNGTNAESSSSTPTETQATQAQGYCGKYSVGTDESTGEETFKCQLMFGINGEYSYTVAEDGKKITITNNGEDSVLEKVDNPTFVPSAPENPQIDEKLVGAWDSGTGLYYYFGEDGRMYCNSYGTTFTYFTYNTKLNKVTAVYDMGGEQTDTYDYTFDGNDLVFDGMKYTQITPEKMLSAIQSY